MQAEKDGASVRRKSLGAVALVMLAVALALPVAASADPPTVTTGPAELITETSAFLTGTVNPGGLPTTFHFEYATDADFTSSGGYTNATRRRLVGAALTAPDQGVPFLVGDQSVGARVDGLTAGTTYHYRIVAVQNACVGTPLVDSCPIAPITTSGGDRTFRTQGPPTVATLDATDVDKRTATLNGTINPNGLSTQYRFEYGVTTSYGNSVPVPDASAGSGTATQSVSQSLSGLQRHTTYHFRIVATNSAGTSAGADKTFTTG